MNDLKAIIQNQIFYQLLDMYCIELRPLTHNSNGKGALCSNYTKDRSCWFKYPNVPERWGLLLQPNGLLVVDIDKPKLLNWRTLKPTFTVKTGSGGYHLIYKNAMNVSSDHSPKWGEIKATGHIVGVGVLHGSGNYYTVQNNFPIQPIFPKEFKPLSLQHAAAPRGAMLKQQGFKKQKFEEVDSYPDWETTYAEMEWILKIKTRVLFKNNPDRSGKDFLIALTLAEHGIDQNLIYSALKKWGTSKIKERGHSYVKHTVIAAVNTALQNQNSIYKKKRNGGEILPDIKEGKVYGKVKSGDRFYYKLSEKEMQKGSDTITFLSLEKAELLESDDGTIFYSKNPKKIFTLPKDEEVLHTLGNILLSYPEIHNGQQQDITKMVKPKEKKKT